jgi:hypothetical protein
MLAEQVTSRHWTSHAPSNPGLRMVTLCTVIKLQNISYCCQQNRRRFDVCQPFVLPVLVNRTSLPNIFLCICLCGKGTGSPQLRAVRSHPYTIEGELNFVHISSQGRTQGGGGGYRAVVLPNSPKLKFRKHVL